MNILILTSSVSPEDSADEQDTLIEAEYVRIQLSTGNNRVEIFPFTRNPMEVLNKLSKFNADMVFNLVETIGGKSAEIFKVLSLLELMDIPYTGSSSKGMMLSTDKILAKRVLKGCSISTPAMLNSIEITDEEPFSGPWILKPSSEEGSSGFLETSVFSDWIELCNYQKKLPSHIDYMVEKFINGREFNVAVLPSENNYYCLGVSEIIFKNFPENKPRILDYKAKWEPDSFEYENTIRSFEFSPEDEILQHTLKNEAIRGIRALDIDGYCRVDFRVDENGVPYILEINANPCISPDAGFMAAAAQSSFQPDNIIHQIISQGQWRHFHGKS
ncbi:MAG: ATP-grasp domain-containing protein [Deltaproteobacteria bacterium]|nr:ATP-grasp domain-containing protein [Deltaproteobacteria bacterium]